MYHRDNLPKQLSCHPTDLESRPPTTPLVEEADGCLNLCVILNSKHLNVWNRKLWNAWNQRRSNSSLIHVTQDRGAIFSTEPYICTLYFNVKIWCDV